MAGSRPGALVATAWVSLVHLGEEGLVSAARTIMEARDQLVSGLSQIEELGLVGSPEMGVVAFRSCKPSLNIYALNDWLSSKGWHMNALQVG